MRIDKVSIKNFKNLRDFEIDIDEDMMKAVLLGKNASGKSNFLEALVIIFRDLDLDNSPSFEYTIKYECNGNIIEITANPSASTKYKRVVNGAEVSKKDFYSDRLQFLPRYLFAYYTGSATG